MPRTQIEREFLRLFGNHPAVRSRAPGRVNIIGEHTDYNGGYVLPMAVDRYVEVACSADAEARIRVVSSAMGECTIGFARLEEHRGRGWMSYIAGVIHGLLARKIRIPGAQLLIESDLPVGAGLSSSAAMEVAVALALLQLADVVLERREVAQICLEAEHDFAGVPCGIMDQYAVLFGGGGNAMFLDCASQEFEKVPSIPPEFRLVLLDSGQSRQLAASGYRRRREECAEALEYLSQAGIRASSLSEVTPLALFSQQEKMPGRLFFRALHVIGENRRTIRAAAALRDGNMIALGRLMYRSHQSLAARYEVSTKELDRLVRWARNADGILGARLTGAGFGGYTVNLVKGSAVDEIVERSNTGSVVIGSGETASAWRI